MFDLHNNQDFVNEGLVNRYLAETEAMRMTDDDVEDLRNHLMETFRGWVQGGEQGTGQSNR